MVEALRIQLSNFTPIEGTQDSWIWTKDEAGRFSVKSAYAVLQGEVREPIHRVYHKLWSLKAPSNVLSLAWKVLLNMIQSKENMRRRNALHGTSQSLCSLCSLEEESSSHFFFTCIQSWKVWCKVYQWLGDTSAMSNDGISHFLQFLGSFAGKDRKNGKGFVWLATIWSLWNYRNNVIFQGKDVDLSNALELIQYKSWIWLKVKVKGFRFTFYEWLSNPLVCLEVL